MPLWTVWSLTAGAAGLGLLGWYERSLIDRGGAPLLDIRAVKPSGVKAAFGAGMLIMAAYFGFVLTFTLELQAVRGFARLPAI